MPKRFETSWAIKLNGDQWASFDSYSRECMGITPWWRDRMLYSERDSAMSAARDYRDRGYTTRLVKVTTKR